MDTQNATGICSVLTELQKEFSDVPEKIIDFAFLEAVQDRRSVPSLYLSMRSLLTDVRGRLSSMTGRSREKACNSRFFSASSSSCQWSENAEIRRLSGETSLNSAPFSTVVPLETAKYLDAQMFGRLVACCREFRDTLNSNEGYKMQHVTQKVAAQTVNYSAVTSLVVAHRETDPDCTLTNDMPNCRTILWKPRNWESAAQGKFIESGNFTLQNVSGLYFRFYPRGKERSKPGCCSLYIGSEGTPNDVVMRLSLNGSSHSIVQRLNGEYVDGFVNFCDLSNIKGDLVISAEILHGPLDSHAEDMKVVSTGRSATWTIPRLTSARINDMEVGDRITSDVFSLRELGDDACLVLYPKGDTVDSISRVGEFVNAGLFGSSSSDVTFRLSAGRTRKVLTAFAEKFQTKVTGTTKSCGEFFDACFGLLPDVIDEEQDQLQLTLEVLDTEGKQTMKSFGSTTVWKFQKMQNLLREIGEGEAIHSRYFTFKMGNQEIPWLFYGFSIVILKDKVELTFIQVNQRGGKTVADLDLRLSIGHDTAKKASATSFRQVFNGIHDTTTLTFPNPLGMKLTKFRAEVTLRSFKHDELAQKAIC